MYFDSCPIPSSIDADLDKDNGSSIDHKASDCNSNYWIPSIDSFRLRLIFQWDREAFSKTKTKSMLNGMQMWVKFQVSNWPWYVYAKAQAPSSSPSLNRRARHEDESGN